MVVPSTEASHLGKSLQCRHWNNDGKQKAIFTIVIVDYTVVLDVCYVYV